MLNMRKIGEISKMRRHDRGLVELISYKGLIECENGENDGMRIDRNPEQKGKI